LLILVDVLATQCAIGNRPLSRVLLVRDKAGLFARLEEWEELARAALEPNVFFEPWMLLPAIDSFGRGRNLLFVLVYVPDPVAPDAPLLLSGFFPLERVRSYRGLPVAAATLWTYVHCFLGTPLLRKERARDALVAFLEWMRTSAEVGGVLELPKVAGEGPFQELLADALGGEPVHSLLHARALFVPAASAESYLSRSMSGKKRKELRRLRRRLADEGPVEFRELRADGPVEEWAWRFLELESSGWKGRRGSAFAADEENRRFFLETLRGAFRRGRLMMLELRLGERTIAMKCNLLAGAGSFAFKIAYDEAYARFSPGVLLELENVRRLHARPEIAWMDSCATAGHAMIEGLWKDRRVIQTVVMSTGSAGGGFVVSALPFLKWVRRQLLPRSGPAPGRMAL
jgi:Acetyltransferase (GNAT) domain